MSELIDVILPADQVEGTRSQVQRWLKAVGQPVKRHEPLVEIETDKVTVEVSSPGDGVLAEIVAAEGVDVEPGAVLGRLGAAAAGAGGGDARGRSQGLGTASRARAPQAPAAAAGRMSPAVRRLARGARPRCRRRCEAAAKAGASPWRTCWRPGRRGGGGRCRAGHAARSRGGRRAPRAAHADAPAHRGAHGGKPPAHGAARHERVRVRHDGRARRSREAQAGIRAPRTFADADRVFRRGLRRRAARGAGGEWALDG